MLYALPSSFGTVVSSSKPSFMLYMIHRAAVFIDNGYLSKVVPNGTKIDFEKFCTAVCGDKERLRTYFYDCMPYRSEPPTEEEKSRYAGYCKFRDIIENLPRFQMRFGKLRKNRNGSFEQKRVDILMAVELVRLSWSHQIVTPSSSPGIAILFRRSKLQKMPELSRRFISQRKPFTTNCYQRSTKDTRWIKNFSIESDGNPETLLPVSCCLLRFNSRYARLGFPVWQGTGPEFRFEELTAAFLCAMTGTVPPVLEPGGLPTPGGFGRSGPRRTSSPGAVRRDHLFRAVLRASLLPVVVAEHPPGCSHCPVPRTPSLSRHGLATRPAALRPPLASPAGAGHAPVSHFG